MAFFVVSALIGSRVVSFGMTDATSVSAAKHPTRRATVLVNTAAFGGLCGLLGGGLFVGVLALVQSDLPRGINGTMLLLLWGGILANTLSAGGSGFLRGCGRFKAYGRLIAVFPWVYVIALGVLWIGPGITIERAAIACDAYLVSAAIAALVASARVDGISRPDLPLLRETMAFGVRAWVGTLAGILNARVDQIVMGFITTEAILGVYSVAVNVSEVLLYLPNATAAALLPAIMRSAPEDRASQAMSVFRRLAVVTAAGSLAAGLVGVPLIPVLFGHPFHSSILPFVILLPGGIGYAALVVAEASLLAVGSPQRASLSMVVALAVGLVLDFALVPSFGASGASAAATAAFLVSGVTGIALFKRSVEFPWRDAIPGRSDIASVVHGVSAAIRPLVPARR